MHDPQNDPRAGLYSAEFAKLDRGYGDLIKSDRFRIELKKSLTAAGLDFADVEISKDSNASSALKMRVLSARISAARRAGIIGQPSRPSQIGGSPAHIPYSPIL